MPEFFNNAFAYNKPFPGRSYIVKSGDTFANIAARAYGDSSEAETIKNANIFSLKEDVLVPGNTINIPILPTREALRTTNRLTKSSLSSKEKDTPTLFINGQEIKHQIISIFRSMETAVSVWSASLDWEHGKDSNLDSLFTPFEYPKASVYIGSNMVINGLLYDVRPELGKSGKMGLVGYSYTADGVDSTLKPPYEVENITLEQRAKELVAPLGVRAIFDDPSDGIFDRITASESETIFSHLLKLAKQRDLLLTTAPGGDFIFTKAKNSNVGIIVEGEPGVLLWKANFSGRKRFNVYRAVAETPDYEIAEGIAIDKKVPRARFSTFRADETLAGNIKKAAEVRRSRQLAKAISINLDVDGWFAPNETIWQPNTILTIKSKTLFIKDGFDLIIKSVNLISDNSGKRATLMLELPQSYDATQTIEDPWS